MIIGIHVSNEANYNYATFISEEIYDWIVYIIKDEYLDVFI